jgi:hypothetical protein
MVFSQLGCPSSQVEQSKMTSLVKMDSGDPVKWHILCYLNGQNNY